ncbi:cytochrome b N-terminal domain-containing protein [Streptomyces sp. AGS-58]|uniref:cytochrome b N-terminal domain-containing protein n=1 Tax=unclassified Streptomyces TaxID=2593676 RepID=UPI0035A2B2FA
MSSTAYAETAAAPGAVRAIILLLPGLLLALVVVHLALVIHQKHTQRAEPGRTDRDVVGKAFFPQYTAKSAGLLFAVAGVLTLMAAVMQINLVWSFGPYRSDQVSTTPGFSACPPPAASGPGRWPPSGRRRWPAEGRCCWSSWWTVTRLPTGRKPAGRGDAAEPALRSTGTGAWRRKIAATVGDLFGSA